MSTQLILYPQTYEGQYSYISSPSTIQYIVNGIFFTGFNSTSLHNSTAPHPPEDAIDNQPPTVLGNWYRFTTTGGDYGAVTAPTYALGAVQLSHNAVTPGLTGLYQKLSNLVVGAVYDIKISIVTPQPAEVLHLEMYSGNVLYSAITMGVNTSTITQTFTAQTPNDTFLIYYGGVSANLSISKISILQSPTSPSLIYTELYDGQVICDLYQEEDIPLTLSIDDFKNVAEQVQSYSKDFNLPATKRNNQIFNNMFEVTRADDGLIFNPYVKTKCVLKEDGFILFEGYLRMIDIKDKEGEISYNVNLYSEVIALADVLKDATFSELDFTELEHNYNKTQIKYSWNDAGTGITYLNPSTSGFRDAYSTLKYPFIDWGHQYLIGGSTTTIATSGNPELTTLEQAFRPCIQLKYLINRIFAASGFNYTSDFFDSADFEKLYMDFNWGSGNSPVHFTTSGASITQSGDAFNYAPSGSWAVILFLNDLPSFTWSTESGYDQATGIFTVTSDVTTYNIGCHIWVTFFTYSTIWVEWVSVDAVTGIVTIHSSASYTHTSANSSIHMFAMPIIVTLNTGDTLYPRFQSDLNLLNKIYTGNTMWATISSATFTTATLLQTLRGELGQWDFLKGIMTMFNLVSMVDENDPNNILIEPYSDIFITNPNSERLDWTEKIDASEMELKPLTDLNKNTIFQFVEDDDDYCFNIYKNSTGRLYGSKVFPPVGSAAAGFSILQGTKEIVAEPFAATVSKPLMPQFSEFIIPSLYAMSDDGTTEGFDNSPRIFYNNGEKGTGASYFIPTQNGVTGENQEDFLQFSHLTDIPTIAGSTDFVFESQQLFPGVGNAPTDNLFSMYWQPYFNELYNADTRTMTLKVNLSPSDVAAFKFYDTVFIKNRVFRVNKIEYKPNDLATVEFILIP
jgi:hypothetical protein